ncbi:MAG TPA: hypothetical protein VNL97_00195 [Solirubrobacterales bacterium]|nr:hypothetical protein [Solirubrobacterales bacterium]
MKAFATATLGAALAAFVLCVAPASAQIAVESFSTTSTDSQAGGHPDLTTSFSLAGPGSPEAARSITFEAPEGVFGNPNALSRCTASDFALDQCPLNSQAGLVTIYAKYQGNPEYLLGTAPLFDIAPQEGETARFSFAVPVLNIPIAIPVSVRTGSDYGLRFKVSEVSQLTPLSKVQMTFWGMPGAASHDQQRFERGSPGEPANCPELASAACIETGSPVSIPVAPMIDYPTTCNGQPLTTELIVQSYQDPEHPTHATDSYPPVTGCEHETFNPVLSASLTTEDTDSASGLNVNFFVPQTLGKTPSPSQAKAVTVALPAGLTINPDAADGQSACTDAQAGFGSDGPAACPDNSKVGTVTIGTPALDGDLIGSLYIAAPRPGDQYRLFLVLDGFGIHAKLVGSFHPDPATGKLTATFEGLPQVPFEEFDIHLFASDRGLLATPTACTLYPVKATFFPWNEALAPQTSQQFFSLTSGPLGATCPGQVRPFEPRLVAGTSNPAAGAFSDFHLKLDRDDGDQFLSNVNFRMPPGFTGSLRGISYCPEGQILGATARSGREEQAAPSCPATSFVGTTNVAAGPGSHPFHAVGRMYLAGPLGGAPLSLAAVTPALAGPYDYGVVVVRVALHINLLTAQVSAVSDPMPQIIGGIPIRMRSIQVNIDRENFTINPTNCSPLSVESQGVGDQGTATNFSSYFHAVNCSTLGFAPRMVVRQLGGRKATKRSRDPSLRFDLYTRPGDANISSVAVTLPRAFGVDQRHLGNICSRAELAASRCAGRQPIGTVETETPLLDEPLKGLAYAVSGFGLLPHLAFILEGQVTIIPEAESSSVAGGKLRTVVPVVPDAPIGHFRLTLYGGSQGYITNTRSLCSSAAKIAVAFKAQNGRSLSQTVTSKTACPARRKAKPRRP